MGFDFNFRFAEDKKDLDKLSSFLLKQSLSYPNYEDWVNRSIEEMKDEYKKSILAFSEGFLVGNLIFQPHKQFPRVREIKNLRVHPKLRERYFGVFMLRQAEKESEQDYDALIADVRSDQISVINTMRSYGYDELLRTPLYESNIEEVVMVKRFKRTPKAFFEPLKKDIIYHSY